MAENTKVNIWVCCLIIVFLLLSGCEWFSRYSVVTVIGIDRSGSFMQRGEAHKKQLIGEMVFDIIKTKAEFQQNDKLWELRKWLFNLPGEESEKVIIAPISFRGIEGVRQFLIFNDDPLSILSSKDFTDPQGVSKILFPEKESPADLTDFLQFFRETNSVIHLSYSSTQNLRIHYILITDGLPDTTGRERRYPADIASQELIDKYGESYFQGLTEIFAGNVKISFVGIDSNILEFWNYVVENTNEGAKVEIEHVSTNIEYVNKEKIEQISDPRY